MLAVGKENVLLYIIKEITDCDDNQASSLCIMLGNYLYKFFFIMLGS